MCTGGGPCTCRSSKGSEKFGVLNAIDIPLLRSENSFGVKHTGEAFRDFEPYGYNAPAFVEVAELADAHV